MDRAQLYNYSDGHKYAGKKPAEIFNEIAENNTWLNAESISGEGSSLAQTAVLINQLPEIFRKHAIVSLLDIPCGDFNWFSRVALDGISYLGGDIVEKIIMANNANHANEGVQFKVIDLLSDALPSRDLVFCRDCLVHFSFSEALQALKNIVGSGSGYLMTTTFTGQTANTDIQTGGWRPLNLELAPFCFPKPLLLLNEQCTEKDGAFRDKSVGLWKVTDLVPLLAL